MSTCVCACVCFFIKAKVTKRVFQNNFVQMVKSQKNLNDRELVLLLRWSVLPDMFVILNDFWTLHITFYPTAL